MDESFSLGQTDNFNSFISDNELILILLCIVDITPFMGLTEVTTDTNDHIRSPYGSVPTVLSPQFAFELLGSFKRSQMWINIHFMLINSPDCSTCLFSWYGLLIMVGGVGCVGGDFSQTRSRHHSLKFSSNAQYLCCNCFIELLAR